MHASFQTLFDKIESQRAALINSVRDLTADQITTRPTSGKWSIAEILSHIVSAEKLSLMYLQKKVLAIDATKDSGVWEEVKINLLKLSQRLPGLKFKVPKVLEEKMTTYVTLQEITSEWDKVRNELKEFLEKIPDARIQRMIYRHVRAGYLNTRHALIFFREHIIHHTPQIKRLVNKG